MGKMSGLPWGSGCKVDRLRNLKECRKNDVLFICKKIRKPVFHQFQNKSLDYSPAKQHIYRGKMIHP
jgi:hypothetical protein